MSGSPYLRLCSGAQGGACWGGPQQEPLCPVPLPGRTCPCLLGAAPQWPEILWGASSEQAVWGRGWSSPPLPPEVGGAVWSPVRAEGLTGCVWGKRLACGWSSPGGASSACAGPDSLFCLCSSPLPCTWSCPPLPPPRAQGAVTGFGRGEEPRVAPASPALPLGSFWDELIQETRGWGFWIGPVDSGGGRQVKAAAEHLAPPSLPPSSGLTALLRNEGFLPGAYSGHTLACRRAVLQLAGEHLRSHCGGRGKARLRGCAGSWLCSWAPAWQRRPWRGSSVSV